jgi:hypothetical protein
MRTLTDSLSELHPPILRMKYLTRLKIAWTKTHIVNKLTFLLTLVIAGANIAYVIYARKQFITMSGQLGQMQSSSGQTDQMLGLVRQQLGELHNQAFDTHDLAVQAKQQADASKQQATNTKRLAENAGETLRNTQSAFRDDERAWLGIGSFRVTQFEQSKPIKVDIQVKNSGKTPALNIQQWMRYRFSTFAQVGPLAPDLAFNSLTNEGSSPPQGDQTLHIEIPWASWTGAFASMSIKRNELSIFGEIDYNDVTGRSHKTQVCLHMPDADTRELFFCDRWNDMN